MEAATPIVQKIAFLAKRLESARTLVQTGAVTPGLRPDTYRVVSPANGHHLVRLAGPDQTPDCTCHDFHFRGRRLDGWCKHRLAVELYLAAHPAPQSPQFLSPEERLERDLAELF